MVAQVSSLTLGTWLGPGWICVTCLPLGDLAVSGKQWVSEMGPGPSVPSWPPVSQCPTALLQCLNFFLPHCATLTPQGLVWGQERGQ